MPEHKTQGTKQEVQGTRHEAKGTEEKDLLTTARPDKPIISQRDSPPIATSLDHSHSIIDPAVWAYHSPGCAAPIESDWPVRHSENWGHASRQSGGLRLEIVKKGEESGETLSMGYARY